MSYVDSECIDQIKSALDIVDIIGEAVVLKQKGRNFVGLCPFHSEKTPSFTVNPEKQIFYCFGCGEGGDVISFLMKHDHLDFPEAIKILAQKAGIEIETKSPASPRKNQKFARLYEINRLAAYYFYRNLRNEQSKPAIDYLLKRDVNADMCKAFAIGYSLDSWDALLSFFKSRGIRPEEAVQAGLAIAKENGSGYFDRFRKRLMFPILDVRGRVIGFGGRAIDGEEPKYLNSPETEVFQKKLNLYGLKQAIPQIRRTGQALIMEGYMDVIAAHQFGHTNAVASLGTAFTPEQARLLCRYAKEVVLAYDSDEAGRQATLRGLDIFENLDLKVRVLSMPTGKDPDDFLRTEGSEAFGQLIVKALSAFEYRLKLAVENHNIQTVQGKIEATKEVLPALARIKSPVEHQEYVKLVARKLQIDEDAIYQELKESGKLRKVVDLGDKKGNFRHNIEGSHLDLKSKLEKLEHNLLKLVVEHPEIVLLIEKEIDYTFFIDPKVPSILQAIKQVLLAEGDTFDVMKILGSLQEEEERQLLLRVSALEPLPYSDRIVEDLINSFKMLGLRRQEKRLRRQISESEKEGNFTVVHELTLKLMQLQKQIQSLK
ncbi:MAG: DNA primase [Zhaonellaceae bacterium]|nr:DNA primase [Clostridia bacterium]